ncbi:hypothetical protein CLU79DRAFT_832189 [Phycomyces nitens]|nr:hypothetical protein CLU79DRAFT_832189 [Phycomyces nitens]
MDVALASSHSDTDVYTAVYSSVNVFEMTVHGVAIMRRRSDSYMNATQILKLAGIDKGKRTKILDREVLTGEHEKVQGGYGKYQGTWIPWDKGKELAERYQVLEFILPLVEFDIAAYEESGDQELVPTKEQALAVNPRRIQNVTIQDSTQSIHTSPPTSPYCTIDSPASSPYHRQLPVEKVPHSRKRLKLSAPKDSENSTKNEHQRNVLMNIFLSDEPIPDALKNPKTLSSINIDLVIDEQGHTALHWSVAMAKIQTVEWLITKGANTCRVNYAGETPLMRGVMVTDSFDNDCFPKLLDILSTSLRITDHKNRTVLHHTAITAGVFGRSNAAIYYMQHLLSVMRDDEQLKAMINSKDMNEDTPLSIATRVECKEMVDLLMLYGASLDYSTTPEHIMTEDENKTELTSTAKAAATKAPVGLTYKPNPQGLQIVSTVQNLVASMDAEFNKQLSERDSALQNANESIKTITYQLEKAKIELQQRHNDTLLLAEAQERIRKFEKTLQAGWNSLDNDSASNDEDDEDGHGDIEDIHGFDSFDEDSQASDEEPINSPGILSELTITKSAREQKLERHIRQLQNQIEVFIKAEYEHKREMELLRSQPSEKEIQCKRLIAACCNLPFDKIDDFLEPLSLVIESDPPDMDMTRVVDFMERMKRSGINPETLLEVPEDTTSGSSKHTTPASVL